MEKAISRELRTKAIVKWMHENNLEWCRAREFDRTRYNVFYLGNDQDIVFRMVFASMKEMYDYYEKQMRML